MRISVGETISVKSPLLDWNVMGFGDDDQWLSQQFAPILGKAEEIQAT